MAVELEASDFAVAGAREGFGPFLGVDPQRRGFDPALTGWVMSRAGTAGLVANAPLGIDRIASKRTTAMVAVPGIAAGAHVVAQTTGVPAAFAMLGCIAALGLTARLVGRWAVDQRPGADRSRVDRRP